MALHRQPQHSLSHPFAMQQVYLPLPKELVLRLSNVSAYGTD